MFNCTNLDNISYNDNESSCIVTDKGPKSYNWPVLFLFTIVFVAIGGNIMVCLAVLYERKLRNMFNFFLVSLATSDMLSATLVMPVTIVKAFVGDFEVPLLMCMIWYALDVLFTSSTIIHLTMISVDRYRALKYPLKYGASKRTKHTFLKIAIVWILAFCVAGPLFVLSMYDKKKHVAYKGCGPESPTFVITATVISFYLPLLIMTIMYILTVLALHKQAKAQKLMQKTQHSKKLYSAAGKSDITFCNSMHSDLGSGACISVSPSMDRCSGSNNDDIPSGYTSNVVIDNSTSPENSNTPLLKPKCQKQTTILNRNTSKASPNENIPLKEMSFLSPSNQPPSSNGALYVNNNHQNSTQQDIPNTMASCNTSECEESTSSETPPHETSNNTNKLTTTPNVSIKVSQSFSTKLKSKLSHHKRHRKSRKSYSSVEKSRKAVQVLGVLFAVFLFCYFPFFLTYTIKGTCVPVSECAFQISDTLLTVFEWMGYSGSMLNPIIYHIFNKEFRRSFYRFIKCKSRRK